MPYGDLVLKKAPLIKFEPTEFNFFVDKIPKKKMVTAGLEWYGEKFSPEVKKYIKNNVVKYLVSNDAFISIKSIMPEVLYEKVVIETKQTTEEWCTLLLENRDEFEIDKFRKEHNSFTIFELPVNDLKQCRSFFVDHNCLLLTINGFEFLCNEKILANSQKNWLGKFGDWSIRFF